MVPERANLPYYIISMKWFTKWQKYTGCVKVVDAIDDDDEDAVLGRGSSAKPKFDKTRIILGDYPGEINTERELRDLLLRNT